MSAFPERVAKWGSGDSTVFAGSVHARSLVLCHWNLRKSVSLSVASGCFAWQAWGIVATSTRCSIGRAPLRAGERISVRFAWQEWRSGRRLAFDEVLDGGSAWQGLGIAHVGVAQSAFHIAGVGGRAL